MMGLVYDDGETFERVPRSLQGQSRGQVDERCVHVGSDKLEGRATADPYTNPEINVIVYHRGNVIPDREDKWRQNTIRCTAVGRPSEMRSRAPRSTYLHTATNEKIRRTGLCPPPPGANVQRGSRWGKRARHACVTNSVTSTKDGRWLV